MWSMVLASLSFNLGTWPCYFCFVYLIDDFFQEISTITTQGYSSFISAFTFRSFVFVDCNNFSFLPVCWYVVIPYNLIKIPPLDVYGLLTCYYYGLILYVVWSRIFSSFYVLLFPSSLLVVIQSSASLLAEYPLLSTSSFLSLPYILVYRSLLDIDSQSILLCIS